MKEKISFEEMCKLNIPIPSNIKKLMQTLLDNGFEAYIVGGAVRDYHLGVEPHDYDIFTNCKDLLKVFPEGHVIGGEERQEKILTVVVNGVEISSYRSSGDRKLLGETLEQHQATCDFTINAMACDIDGKIVQENDANVRGIIDIKERELRFVGNPQQRIDEDPLRILRGLRFKIKYNLLWDKETKFAIENTDISHLPVKRIRDELIKILKLNNLDEGFLQYIIKFVPIQLFDPDMNKDGGKHHNETPFEHSIYSFLEACKITDNVLIRIAALFHDIGKSVTRCEDKYICPDCGEVMQHIKINKLDCDCGLSCCESEVKPKITFYNHHTEGAKLAKKWMQEMKFSHNDIDFVYCLISNHMFALMNKTPSKKSYIKLFKNLMDNKVNILDYAMVCYADNQGNKAKHRIKFGDYIKENECLNTYYKFKQNHEPFQLAELCIGGKDLIDRYKLIPGPLVGNTLRYVFNRIIDGCLKNNKEAIFKFLDNNKILYINNKKVKK